MNYPASRDILSGMSLTVRNLFPRVTPAAHPRLLSGHFLRNASSESGIPNDTRSYMFFISYGRWPVLGSAGRTRARAS